MARRKGAYVEPPMKYNAGLRKYEPELPVRMHREGPRTTAPMVRPQLSQPASVTAPESLNDNDVIKKIIVNIAVAIGLLVVYYHIRDTSDYFTVGVCSILTCEVPWQTYGFETIFIVAFCIYLFFRPAPLTTRAARMKYYAWSAAPFIFVNTVTLPYSAGEPLVFGLLPLFIGMLLLSQFHKQRAQRF